MTDRVSEAVGPGYRVERVDGSDGVAALRFAGELRFRQCFQSWKGVRELTRPAAARMRLDLSAVDHLDGAATALLLELKNDLASAGAQAEIVGADGPVRAMLELYGAHAKRPSQKPPPAKIGILDQIGRETLELVRESNALDFIGDVAVAGVRALRHPSLVNWSEVPRLMERAGADGVPIVLMIGFLVGLVTAFQAAIQLEQFGASIFVADLVGLSMTRELGPLMTAIIVAGRSGAAFSAELANAVVMDSGRPVLFVPYIGAGKTLGERILIAWKDSRESARAVADALPFLKDAKAVLAIAVAPRDDESVQEYVSDKAVEGFLRRHNVDATVNRMVAPDIASGEFLLSRAADFGADLIVMGGYSRPRLSRLVWGGVSNLMLESMTVPVLMSH